MPAKSTPIIYGIKNCDTMKKARAWLDGHGVAYDFHDYKSEGIARDKLKQWIDASAESTNKHGFVFRHMADKRYRNAQARARKFNNSRAQGFLGTVKKEGQD